MKRSRTGRFAALAAAAFLAAAARPKVAPPPDSASIDVPPLIRSVKGPAKTVWARCAYLIAGRPHGEPAPQLLMLCQNDGKPSVTALASVHPECHALTAEAGPGGGLRVLVGRPGGIDEIRLDAPGAAARSVKLVEDEAVDPQWLADRPDLDGDGKDDLLQATYDGISLWRREDDGRMSPWAGVRLPPRARLDGEWLSLSGKYVVAPVPPAPIRWTWPETNLGKRLKTYRVPLAPAGGTACAAWIDAEAQVYASRAVFLSGEPPRLVALVAPSDKLAFFGNSSLLVAPLVCDETSRGSRPSQRIATDFDANIGSTRLSVADVTGDGLQDALIVGRQGLVDKKIQVAVYAGLPEGGFAATPASGVRSDLEPLAWDAESDVDGDGRTDLVVLDRERVMWARGIAVRGARELPFDLRNPIFVALPGSMKPNDLPYLVDFDGDGRLEALVAGEEHKDEPKKQRGAANATAGSATARADKDSRLVIVRFPETPR